MRAALIGAGILAVVLAGAVIELSCLAAEHPRALPAPGTFTDAVEPELPSASELEQVPGPAGPVLTY